MTMKTMAALAAAAAASAAFAETQYLPLGDRRGFGQSALPPGAAAVVRNGDGTATLYYGNGTAVPDSVEGQGSLRGSVTRRRLGETSYSVAADDSWMYDGSIWVMDATVAEAKTKVGRITVTARDGITLSDMDVTYEVVNTGSSLPVPIKVDVELSADGRSATASLYEDVSPLDPSGWRPYRLTVTAVGAFEREPGPSDYVNDLTERTFTLRDSVGTVDFADLRRDCYHHNDGNLGEDWSSYPARHDAAMGTYAAAFGPHDHYKLSYGLIPTNGFSPSASVMDVTNGVRGARIRAAGYDMMTFYGQGVPKDYTLLNFRSMTPTYGLVPVSPGSPVLTNKLVGVSMKFETSVAGFRAELLSMQYCTSLTNAQDDAAWVTMAKGADYVQDGSDGFSVTESFLDARGGGPVFFRLWYDETIVSYFRVDCWTRAVFHDELVLWSEADRKYYRLVVTGGTLSVEEWHDQL